MNATIVVLFGETECGSRSEQCKQEDNSADFTAIYGNLDVIFRHTKLYEFINKVQKMSGFFMYFMLMFYYCKCEIIIIKMETNHVFLNWQCYTETCKKWIQSLPSHTQRFLVNDTLYDSKVMLMELEKEPLGL